MATLTITPVQLVAPQQLAITDSPIYTAPTSVSARVGRAVFCNTSASAVTITAGITTSGGTLGASTTLISALSVAAGATYVSPELAGAVLPGGSQLHAYASAGGAITFSASGLLIQ